MKTILKPMTALALTLLLAACGNDEATPDSVVSPASSASSPLLQYIPEQTPYFLASSQSMAADQALELIRRSGTNTEDAVKSLRTMLERDGSEEFRDVLETLVQILEDVGDLSDPASFERLGTRPDANSAFYGIGPLPVLRFQLADEERFNAFLERTFAKLDEPLQRAELRGLSYWHASGDDVPVRLLIAVNNLQGVITVAPSDASEALLAQLLGLDLPARSLLDSGELQALEQRHGFTPHGAGFFSSSRFAQQLINPAELAGTEIGNSWRKATTGLAGCSAELERIAARLPGIVFGMREVTAGSVESNIIFLTDSEIVTDLQAMVANVPGLGQRGELSSLGFGANIAAVTSAANRYANQVRDQPFSCEGLQELNQMWAELGQGMNNPAVFMAAPALNGLRVQIDSFDYRSEEDFDVDMLILLSSPSAQGLVGMAANFIPAIAQMNLVAGEAPKPVPSDLLPPQSPPLVAAMSDKAIVVAAGNFDADTITASLSAPSVDRDYLLHMHVAGALYQRLIEVIDAQDIDSSEMDYFTDSIRTSARYYRHSDTWIRANSHGLEIGTRMEFN